MLQRFYEYLLKNQVIFALCIIFFVWFVFQIREIIFSLFLSYIIMAAILPIVNFLRKRRVPKLLAVLIPYFVILLLLVILIIPLVPFVLQQFKSVFPFSNVMSLLFLCVLSSLFFLYFPGNFLTRVS